MTFTKTFNFSTMLSDTEWMREVDAESAVCRIANQFGEHMANGEVGIRDGEPVVMVDDDAHSILSVDDIASGKYRIEVVMPKPMGAYFSDAVADCAAHGQYVAKIAERASRLALYGIPVTYSIGG